jgi:hypothetical protein
MALHGPTMSYEAITKSFMRSPHNATPDLPTASKSIMPLLMLRMVIMHHLLQGRH